MSKIIVYILQHYLFLLKTLLYPFLDTMRFTSIVDRRSDDSATDPDAIAKMSWQFPFREIQQGSSNSSAVSKRCNSNYIIEFIEINKQ